MADQRLIPTPAITAAPVRIGTTRFVPRVAEGVHALVLREGDPAALGPLPEIGRSAATRLGGVVLRLSRERAMLIGRGPAPAPSPSFHSLDQTGFWAMISLEGSSARGVLERHWRPDLDDAAFPPGSVAQSGLSAVPVTLFRETAEGYLILAPRSYAAWLFGELATTLRWVG